MNEPILHNSGGFLKDGRLFIKRKGQSKTCDCRFMTTLTTVNIAQYDNAASPEEISKVFRQGFGCTDHCGHVSEPRTVIRNQGSHDSAQVTEIRICHGTVLHFKHFEDKRIAPILEATNVNAKG